MNMARAEIATVTAGLQIAQAMRSKFTPSIKVIFSEGHHYAFVKSKTAQWVVL